MAEEFAKGGRVEIQGLCSFFVKEYRSYTGRNPKTGLIHTSKGQGAALKKPSKNAAITALKWATGLTTGFILGPILVVLIYGTSDFGGMIAEKLIVGIFMFPILFLGFWAWGTFTKKDPLLINRRSIDSFERSNRPITTCRNCGQGFQMLTSTNEFHPICPKCLNFPPKANQYYDYDDTRKCPLCAEIIKKEAKICKHCGNKVKDDIDIDNFEIKNTLIPEIIKFDETKTVKEFFKDCQSEEEIIIFCEKIFSSLGYRLTGSKEKWTLHFPNGIGKAYFYSLEDLKKKR